MKRGEKTMQREADRRYTGAGSSRRSPQPQVGYSMTADPVLAVGRWAMGVLKLSV